jgi:DNA-binding MarR family transcriptional regulator
VNSNSDIYLRAILATVARQTFPASTLVDTVGKGKTAEKQLAAYNLCDGSMSQSEIAKKLGLDPGNFSKTLGRWIDAGIVIRVTDGRDVRPIHVYPLSDSEIKKAVQK